MADSEIPEVIAQIEEEGHHYLRVPPIRGKWPKWTKGRDKEDERLSEIVDQATAREKELDRDEVTTLVVDLVQRAVDR